MEIRISHLYPELLNLYGDKGNIASLVYRCEKRGIECTVRTHDAGEEIDFETTDILFLGGGNDKEQSAVSEMLMPYKDRIKEYVEKGGSFLAVCGGFELLGNYYKIGDTEHEALGILDMYTIRDSERHIGNIVTDCDIISDKIVGFENHNDMVFADKYAPLGKVISGFGNNKSSGIEGVVYKNLIGTYIHGPLLPKNPKLADYLIKNALMNKYGEAMLSPLDDELETRAHDYAVTRFSQRR